MPLSSILLRAMGICAFMYTGLLQAQHLTISTAGQTGTSGTNWSISGNTLNVTASNVSAHIHPSVITNHLTNIGDLTVVLPWVSGVPRDLYINSSIAYTGSTSRTLTFNIVNDIIAASSISISSSNASLNLVLRTAMSTSNVDHGRIQLDGTTITTNGGHFWAGGGSGSTTWNSLTVGNTYSRTWADDVSGISFLNASLTTSGGSVYMAGMSYNTSDADGENYGINIRNSTITSGAGQIDILGDLKGTYTTGSGLGIFGNSGTVSISSTSGAINLTGTGADLGGTNTGWRRGALLYTLASTGISVTSTSGNITITGTAAFPNNTNDDMMGLQLGSTQSIADGVKITSISGNILLTGSNTRENAGQLSNSVQFITADVANSIRIGHDGTNAYSGNITIEGNSILQNNVNSGSGSISVRSSGTLTIRPSGSAFTYLRAGASGTLTFDNDWNFGTTLSGFTFGKSGNNLAISFSNDITLNGPFTAYGSNMGLNGIAANGDVYIRSTTYIDQNGAKTTSTNGGDLVYWAGSSGESYIRPGTITTNGGHVFMGGDFDAVGTRTWQGLTVGGGYAFSTLYAGIALRGNIDTRVTSNQSVGGDVLLAGESNQATGGDVEAESTNRTISTGNGDITLMPYSEVLQNGGNSLQMVLSTTGRVSVAPVSGKSFWSGQTRTYNGSMSSTTFNGSSALLGLQILNFSSITGLELGTYSGTGVVGDNAYTNSNVKNMTLDAAITIAGPISVYGGNLTINGACSTSVSTGQINLFATGDIIQSAAITTQGGSLLAWADRDGTGGGRIHFNANITTNGGHIYAGGGTTSETASGLTVPAGYASSTNALFSGITINGNTINSGGGVIRMKGNVSPVNGTNAGLIVYNATISSGAGALSLFGQRTGDPNVSAGLYIGTNFGSSAATGNVTITSTTGNIYLEGTADNITVGHSWTHGLAIVEYGGDDVTITSTTGNITLYGDATSAAAQTGEAVGFVIQSDNVAGLTRINTDGGTISITGKSGNTGDDFGSSYRGANIAGNITIGDANSGSITLRYGSLSGNSNTGSVSLQSAGNYVIEGISGGAFAAGIDINVSYSFGSAGTGLRVGSTTNNQDVVMRPNTTVAGPITIYANQFSFFNNLISSTASDIGIYANTHVWTNNVRQTIQTAGGNIYLYADADANGSGQLDIDYLTFNPGSGNTVIRGETVNWNSGSVAGPFINGTGGFTFESSDASFGQDMYTSWFEIDQDGNGISALTFGKSGSTQNVYQNTNLTIAGPVSYIGGTIGITGTLTATNANVNLRATTAVTQSAAITSAGLTLNGTGTFTLTNTSNNFTTLAGGAIGTLIGATQIIDASGGLTIGTVGSNTGLLGSSTIRVETLAGNLTLAGSISTTSISTDAIILTSAKNTAIGVPTGGDILVSGSPTITMGSGAIAKLFSGYDVTSTGLTTLAGGASNARYNYDETTTIFNPALSANNAYAIYRTALGYGDLNIVSSGGDAEGTTWTYASGVIRTTSGTANVLNTDVQTKLNSGNLSIEANKVTFSANVTGTTSNSFSILSKTHILNTNATTITTQGGNILFASNVDDATDGESTTNGFIQLRNGITINSNGGNITFGGGNTSGSDYAFGSSAEDYTEGVRFDALVALNSAGGDITIRGKSYARAVQWTWGASGVGFYYFTGPAGTINSGSGKITIDGFSQTNTSDYASGIYSMHNITITSANTTSDAIRLLGKATGATGHAWGIETENVFSVLATAAGGGITISSSQQIANNYDAVFRGETNILAVSGPIQMLGKQDAGVANGRWFIGSDFYLGSKASSSVTSSSSNITIQYDQYDFSTRTPRLATSGTIDWKPASTSFGQDVATSWFLWNQNSQTTSGLIIGKIGNALNVYINSAITVAGPISVYGGYVEVTGAITSSGTGDILLKGIANANLSVNIGAVSITKTGGTGTLTLQANGRAISAGTIAATGTGVLNVVMWSDFDGDNVGGGSTLSAGSFSTNGGHVWMGGSNSNGGSYTWNGLTVGDGPSIGASGANCNAIDLFGPITTSGGDVLLWASNNGGCGTSGIVSDVARHINAGSGDITFIAPQTGGTIQLTSTGIITLAPNGGSYASALTYGGTTTSGNFTFNTSHYSGVVINSIANVGGLSIGRFNGMLSSGTPVVMGNTSNVTISAAISITGPIEIYGGAIAMNANLTTSSTSTGNMTISGTTISGTGNMAVANGRTASITVTSNSTYEGIISGTSSGMTKLGAGTLTLTKDHTYTGNTTISAGDLQVGSGGSVSQASSGTISNTSGVSIASGSKLILAPNENMTFAPPITGAGGVEIKGMSGAYYSSFLTGTATTMVSNASVLEVLTRITGGLQAGAHIPYNGNQTQTAGAYIKSYNASTNTATLQFQQYDGLFTKCVFALLSQSGADVQIRGNTSIYNGAAYRSGNSLGSDMSTGSTSIGALATSSSASGYGISNVYMSGKVNFTGALTYSGTTTLSNTVTSVTSPNTYSYTSRGTQEITDASSSFPSGSTIVNNGLVIFNRSTALTISNSMSGTEEVLQVGAAITLTGANTHSGNTTIDLGKTLNIGAGGTTGSITGNIINYGTLTFNRSDSSAYAGIISGSGAVIKNGNSATTLTGLNTYTGATTVNAGRLILQRDVPATSSSSYSGAGILVVQPNSNSFTSSVTYPIAGFTVSSSIGGLTIGKPTNTANITVSSATTAAGPITLYGGNIFVQQNLRSTSSGAAILVQATGHIELSTNDTIRTNGGAVTLNATAGGTATTNIRAIYLYSGSGILSNGGNITLGGGYSGTEGNLYAATAYATGGYAIVMVSSTLNAAGGDIKVYGRNVNSYGDGVFLDAVNISTTGTGTIGIFGDSYGGYNGSTYFGGITFENVASTIQTVNGNITMEGILTNSQSSQGYAINFYRSPGSAGQTRHIQILSQTGNIQITADRGSSIGGGIGHSSWGHIYFGSPSNNSFTATGNITFTYSGLVNAGSNGFKVKTTGAVTYEPAATSFDAAQTFPPTTNYVVADGATSLTIGKSGNTANVTLSAAQSIAGPISIYGGTLTFSDNLASTTGGNISLYGNTLSFASGKTVSSTGQLLVTPAAVSTTVGLAGATGTFQVTSTHLSTNFANGFSNITIGSDAQTGNIASNAFTLQDNMTFKTSGTLSLGGNITLGTNNATLGSSLSMGSGTNYFQTNSTGILKRSVGNAGTFTFPVGNSAYNPVSITNNTGSSDEFNLRVLDEVYRNGTSGTILTTPRVKRTWLIGKTNANAGSGINFVFNWNTGESTSGLNAPRLYHHNGSVWDKQTGTTSSTSSSLTYTGYTGTFSPFAVGDDVVLLPVSWLHFDCGKQTSNGTELNWSTASEENSSRFVVERSQNGQAFEPIGYIPAAGYSHSIRQYRFIDPNPLKTRAYYRIAMEENNGQRIYTSICMSNVSADAENNPVKVYPNPSKGTVNIHATEGGTYQISDMAGRLIRAGKLDGITQIEGLKPGVYSLTIQSGDDNRYTQKLLVE